MRIVQLANFYSPISGGLRTVVDTLGRGYAALGHERVLVVPGQHADRTRTDAGLVITVPGLPVGGGYRVMPRSRAVLKLLDALAVGAALMSVEVSDKTTLLAAGEWARAHGVGTVLFSHERLDRWIAARVPRLWKRGSAVLAPAVRSWNKGIATKFDTVVVTSGYAEREFAGLEVALRRVPLGVDLATFRPAVGEPSPGPARLVYAGRLSPEKNPAAVLGAVRVLADLDRPASLDVYGDGPALSALYKLARDLPVSFHGHVGDRRTLAAALSRADVAFAPSVAETFGLSILEAMACGTPVVTSVTGGAPELLAPGAGVAVPATPEGLAAGVLEILSWPAPVRRAAARQRAEQFPWSATIAAMLDLHASSAGTASTGSANAAN
ncbi:MAG TPA: glycosyltransferase [Actinophytocola sp.]|nr:glycosyltransferase [Actinophytocola sp.]